MLEVAHLAIFEGFGEGLALQLVMYLELIPPLNTSGPFY